MALSDRLPVDQGRPCRFTRVFEVMSKEDQTTLGEWINKRLPQRTIVSAMNAEYPDSTLATGSLANHVFARCCCPKDTPHKGRWL